MFRRRVLEKAIKELREKTDFEIEYEVQRVGRKVSNIVFSVTHTGKYFPLSYELHDKELMKKLESHGFTKNESKRIVKEHDKEYIRANIKVVEERIESGYKARSVKALLMDAFKTDYRKEETEYSKSHKKKTEQEQTQKENDKKALLEEAILKTKFKEEQIDKFKAAKKELSNDELEDFKEMYIEKISNNELLKKTLINK